MNDLCEAMNKMGVTVDELAECLMVLFDVMNNMKKCPKCGEYKSLTEYYKSIPNGNIPTYWCKECIEYYIKHTSVGAN
ncbi:unnamed protein product [marine sediment metagenome]|uniref:Uncharacterized protein n=1 Tax=marine sediment metagenome TaxID=412755 RepID=X1HQK6_9ZZZZ